MDYAARLQRLREAVVDDGMDGLVYGTGANFQYFTGVNVPWDREHGREPEQPGCFLVVSEYQRKPLIILDAEAARLPRPGVPAEVAVAGPGNDAQGLLREWLTGRCTRVGLGRHAGAHIRGLLEEVLPDVEWADAEGVGERMRARKDHEEIALLRRAVALTDRVMAAVVGHIRPGVTQPRLEDLIREAGLALGAQDVSFSPAALFVKSGTPPTADPFVYPKAEPLVPGTSVAFDFGFVLDGYCSDFGRSFYCGPAPGHIAGAYRALQESQLELLAQMQPGKTNLGQMFGIFAAAMDRRGYGDRLRARLKDGTLGHQIGVDLHENPWIRPTTDVILQPGMVMAVEPKAWLPGDYYLRVEDIVLVTETGAESLTAFDRQLFELPV